MIKIGIFSLEGVFSGSKVNITDSRLDKLKELFKTPKKVELQAELIYEEGKISSADAIIADKDSKLDLALSDLEFVEARLSKTEDSQEKELLSEFKETLEKEEFLFKIELEEGAKNLVSNLQLLTIKPIYLVDKKEADQDSILQDAYNQFGYISFFTSNEKEVHAWGLKRGMTAWEAAGVIHSDIKKGFIRAEVVHYQDLIKCGHLNSAREQGLLKSENKEYVVQDGDWILFRFNK